MLLDSVHAISYRFPLIVPFGDIHHGSLALICSLGNLFLDNLDRPYPALHGKATCGCYGRAAEGRWQAKPRWGADRCREPRRRLLGGGKSVRGEVAVTGRRQNVHGEAAMVGR